MKKWQATVFFLVILLCVVAFPTPSAHAWPQSETSTVKVKAWNYNAFWASDTHCELIYLKKTDGTRIYPNSRNGCSATFYNIPNNRYYTIVVYGYVYRQSSEFSRSSSAYVNRPPIGNTVWLDFYFFASP